MSLLYKRPDSPVWYVVKTRQSTRTTNRKLAEEFARKAVARAWRDETLGESVRTWRELCAEWRDRKEGAKRSFTEDDRVLRETTNFLARRGLVDAPLADIDATALREYGKQVKARASAATANRHLTIIASMLRMAERLEWLVKAPTLEKYKEQRGLPRWLTREEFARLTAHLPAWVAGMATLAVQTGMRYSNVAGLRWSWIDSDLTIIIVPAGYTKTGRTYTVPISGIAREVLLRLKNNRDLVFENPDRPGETVTSVKFWWKRACKQSGVDCRFHDLRHTWASWHVQAGTPDRVVQEAGGWTSPAMLQRYAHLSTKHLTDYADNLNKDGR